MKTTPLQIEYQENIMFDIIVYDDIHMKLKINHSDGKNNLFFTDELNETLPIPNGLKVYNKDHFEIKPFEETFLLDSSYNYTIKYKNKIVLEIKNKHIFELSSPDRDIEMVEYSC